MSKLQNSDYQYIHTHLNEEAFNELILPHLWQGSRGSKPKISLYKIFNYILKVLYTGCQWKELPIDKGPDGKAEIHYSRVYRKFVQWVTFGSLQEVFVQTLVVLKSVPLPNVSGFRFKPSGPGGDGYFGRDRIAGGGYEVMPFGRWLAIPGSLVAQPLLFRAGSGKDE